MATSTEFCLTALTQRGKPYVFGAEASCRDRSPRAFDCSELVEWSLCRIGLGFVDGAANQLAVCKARRTTISVAKALATPGALLFRIARAGNHVAISLGNGSTMEAKGRAYGTGVFKATGRTWTHGALIPGLQYTNVSVARPPAGIDWAALAKMVEMCKAGSVLQLGSPNSTCVKFAQQAINRISGRGLTVDGDFGPATDKAVRDLQRWLHLTVDGVIGPQTWRILYP